ncbi:Regulator of sigma-E protease RseP [Aliiroseovarius sp. xm-v-201]|uniref:RIP metalloprotease RseP n=1 Tax=unclassified Aliiroseovarius TaxID=2623558 RepID=UPI0015682920|nr:MULTISPECIES: RIP metalloprotease RseP [unclassified Aliiroseovarius]NRP50835.1 Regulator of sigma-E protease RseP [Aliiroseovarius sp. xm-m-354]NRQ05587.1 Regulator of sigma-E protease RseP [Aliiroseovarius sp. xm-m-309]NRQ08792.1 Regulator of sigma-E protease RseP [Aliiroseovarius sp. xm-v-201]
MDLISLLPDFGNLAFTVLAFVVALTIIVAVHEYGHYIVGRWSGIKADVFSIGMGPVLYSRVDKHGTKWQVASYPIGGYVKFAGDANAASGGADEEVLAELSPEERRHTMPGAPLWARTATVAAGPIFNFILSILLFGGILMWVGVGTDPLTVGKAKPLPGVEDVLQPGDEILSIAGAETPKLSEFYTFATQLPNTPVVEYRLNRDGKKVVVIGPHPFPALIGSVTPKSAAIEAGLRRDDLIETVDGNRVATFEGLRDLVVNGEGAPLTLGIYRDGERLEVTLTPRRQDLPLPEGGFETRWLIGVSPGLIFEPATRTPGVLESLEGGVDRVIYIIRSSLSGLWHMISGKISSCNLSGPIGIAQVSGQAASQGVSSFIAFIGMLSTAVGLLNLFPIPVLDGGHLVFFAYEAVTRRKPSDKVMNILLIIGLSLVLSLMVFGVTNDLFC